MQVDDVPTVAHNVAPNVVPNAVPNVAPNVVPNAVPNVASNIVPNVVANVVPNTAPIPVPNVALNLHQATWPVETDLIFVSGTTKVMLTAQRPLMRCVIHGAFDEVRVSLMFSNAFPDAVTVLSMTRDALVTVAESRERSSSIHQRLLNDEGYVASMIRLVSHYACM
jgi:hypothetical protein